MWTALWAAISMVFQDVFATWMVVAEGRGAALQAGIMDTIQWLFAFFTGAFAYSSVIEHGWHERTFVIIAAVSVANLVGTYIGVRLGRQNVKKDPDIVALLAANVALEKRMETLEGRRGR